MWTQFASSVLFPLHERLKRHSTVAVRRGLEQSQWWSPEQLQALQVQRLRALLTQAGQHVPYYRALFARLQFDPASVTQVADLQRLPCLTKADIRANGDALRHAQARDLARFNTGGSSGEPLVFFIGRERVSHDVAAKWRATRWWDVDIGDREIVVWGSPIELGAQDRVRAVRDTLLRTELLPAFRMSDEMLDHMVARIRERRPRMLFGYPSALSHIARHAQKRGLAMDQLGIRVAFCTSEQLYPDQRETIERSFGCPVANGYGSRDAGFIAHQCPSGSMHITAEDIVVEIVDPAGQVLPSGQAGEIVVTHLATKDFPFIRYRTGDIAVLGAQPCACGRGLPVLQEVQGRTTDFVVAADGTVMHGLALIYLVRDLPSVRLFRIEQLSLTHTVVQLVGNPAFTEADGRAMVEGFRRRLGNAVRIDLQLVNDIPAEKSGKFRYVVSRVPAH
ncbi:MAG: capsule biosynthesis protein CapK [Burkholderiales bacterium PBB5]|nr:MAG: capsule biosynthesis protein CapK [Burkholderiales bacterium PBB5]